MAAMRREFVRLGDRDVHLRRGGKGPVVVLLHQSPQSSRALLPWMDALARDFHVLAPDTPGFGHSDPLPRQQPGLLDFAANLDRLLDTLGIERAIVWGVHTGASIGCTLARAFPRRVALLVCDGLARFDAAERAQLVAHYLPPFEPAWDGSHLLWLWARLREQTLYWPWFDGRREARLGYAQAAPERLHGDVQDVLDAGDSYRQGYRAAFAGADPDAIADLRVPAFLLYRADDVLATHIPDAARLPPGVITRTVEGGVPALQAQCAALFAQHAAQASRVDANPGTQASCARDGHPRRVLVPTSRGAIAARWQPRGAHARLVLQDLGRAASTLVALLSPPVDDSLLVPDLPGHGASDHGAVAPADVAAQLHELVDALGIAGVDLHAHGLSAACAAHLARRLGPRLRALRLQGPLPLAPDEQARFLAQLPAPGPDRDGHYLVAAWNWARQRSLFLPWMPPVADAACRVAEPPPQHVHADACELLRLGASLHATFEGALADDWPARLEGLGAPCRIRGPGAPAIEARLARLAAGLGADFEPGSPP
jgi:pimeloyl-ACP methyl ester carboxylesterase